MKVIYKDSVQNKIDQAIEKARQESREIARIELPRHEYMPLWFSLGYCSNLHFLFYRIMPGSHMKYKGITIYYAENETPKEDDSRDW